MVASSDIFVIFDHVQFERKSWQQRNRIKTANGVAYLSVPVQKMSREAKISEIKISYEQGNALSDHWKTIELAYKKAPYFDKYKTVFEKIYSKKYVLLADLNVEIIKAVCDILGIKTKIILSSKLELADENMKKTEKVVNLCKKAGITHLYDAKGAEDFLDVSLFKMENFLITFQNFDHPIYTQLWGKFVPYLSIIDLIFNHGDKSLSIIKSGVKSGT